MNAGDSEFGSRDSGSAAGRARFRRTLASVLAVQIVTLLLLLLLQIRYTR